MIEKIKEDITERSIKKNFSLLPKTNGGHEYDYRICKSSLDGLEGYYFVVSRFIRYGGVSINDFGYIVYVYDKDGNFVDNDEINKKCKGRFFQTLIKKIQININNVNIL